jgi:hypothetical protein
MRIKFAAAIAADCHHRRSATPLLLRVPPQQLAVGTAAYFLRRARRLGLDPTTIVAMVTRSLSRLP